MDKSSRLDIPMADQVAAWEVWNKTYDRKAGNLPPWSERQLAAFLGHLASLGRKDLNILDAGCGTGWVCSHARKFGDVTGTDLFDQELPGVRYVKGSIFDVPLGEGTFDVVSAFEVLSHVADQQAFIARLASLLKPGGNVFIATQNKPILERWSRIPGPAPGQIRHWVDHRQLVDLLAPHFRVIELDSVVPVGDQGALRWLNSRKLNMLLGPLEPLAQRLKERFMLGHTLLAWAMK